MPRDGSVLDRSAREKESLLRVHNGHESFLRCAWNVLTRWQEILSADVSS